MTLVSSYGSCIQLSRGTSQNTSEPTLSESVAVDESLSVSGPGNLSNSTVTIQNKRDGDTLTVTEAHGITGSYDADAGVLVLDGEASVAEYESVLRTVAFNNTEADADTDTVDRELTLAVGDSLPFEGTGHYYEFVEDDKVRWDDARDAAEDRSYFGLSGYLVTITSQTENEFVEGKVQGNGWLGASDAATEGDWKWVTGPEAGTQFYDGDEDGNAITDEYENWNDGEPNDSGGNEEYAHMIGPNRGFDQDEIGTWNDLPVEVTSGDYAPQGYVVEYGGLEDSNATQLRDTFVFS